jgi:hypothetical protein
LQQINLSHKKWDMDNRIFALGDRFKGRLNQDRLDFSIDYVRHGESPLALETLCDYLCEHDVPISSSEYEEILHINSFFSLKLDERVITYLNKLVNA